MEAKKHSTVIDNYRVVFHLLNRFPVIDEVYSIDKPKHLYSLRENISKIDLSIFIDRLKRFSNNLK